MSVQVDAATRAHVDAGGTAVNRQSMGPAYPGASDGRLNEGFAKPSVASICFGSLPKTVESRPLRSFLLIGRRSDFATLNIRR